LHHADTDQSYDLGSVTDLRRDGDWIVGMVEIPDGDIERFRSRGLSVVIDPDRQRLTKVTVTPTPRVRGASFSGEGSVLISFTGGEIMPDEIVGTEAAASGAEEQIESIVVRILRKLGLIKTAEEAAEEADTEAVEAAEEQAEDDEVEKQMSAELRAERAARERLEFELATERIARAIGEAVSAGVPPVVAEAIVPVMHGRSEVQMSSGVKPAAEALRAVLDFHRGAVKTKPELAQRVDSV
jgi:hypothetical protein